MHYQKVKKDVKIAVYDLNPQGKNVVFFIHGWPLSHKIFEYQYNELPRKNIRCISMDLRGFGKSDKPWSGYSYDDFADDVYEVIRNLDVNNITLLGFSMGAAIAIRYMSRHKGYRVSKLALVGAAAPSFIKDKESDYSLTTEVIDDLIKKIYMDRLSMVKDFCENLFASKISDTLRKWINSLCFETSGYVTMKTAEALRDENLYGDLERVKVPTAIFHGERDKICPFDLALQLNERIKESKLHAFKNSGHVLFYDEQEKFNEQLINFVRN